MEKHCERLKEALEIRDLKPSMLAYKTGISEASISHYLAGHYEPKTKKLQIMAKALRVSSAWLAGLDVPMTVSNETPIVEPELNEGEQMMLDLFRSASPYQQEMILRMLEAAVSPKE
jgi:transcriptional regulator with XRE-family HTH domain